MLTILQDNFQTLFEDELLKELSEVGIVKKVQEGEKLIEIADYLQSMPLLLSGAIKILREEMTAMSCCLISWNEATLVR